jgi:outer membrane immunogenic protein
MAYRSFLDRLGIISAAICWLAFDTAAAAPPAYDWTGFYIGENGGYTWNRVNAPETPGDAASATAIVPVTPSFDLKGWAGGITQGFNWQVNDRWVAGAEADFQISSIAGNGNAAVTNIVGLPFNYGVFSASQRTEWFGTVRPRVGYLATSNLMIFATGGVAFGRTNVSGDLTLTSPGSTVISGANTAFLCANPPTAPFGGPTCFSGSDAHTSVGWAAGAGVEYNFFKRWSLKLEYLYVDLGSQTTPLYAVTTLGSPPSVVNLRTDAAFNMVRAGFNWRLPN